MRWVLLVALFALATLADCYVDVTCSEAYCKAYLEKPGCPKLPTECTDTNIALGRAFQMPSPTHCNCCDFCIVYLGEGEACVVGGTSQNVPICGPGLGCVKPTTSLSDPSTCQPLETACTLTQREWDAMRENGTLGNRVPRPACDAVGDFQPAHCVPGATCYCVSPVNDRLFGELPYATTDTPSQMTCSCSVSGWRAREALGPTAIVSRCQADGRFDRLQCVDSKCFCVDRDTGSLDGKAWVQEVDLGPGSLPCFDPLVHATGTYRKGCQAERYDIEQTLSLLALDGITGLGLKPPQCDADGTFSKLQETTATWVCVGPAGSKLEDFEVAKTDVPQPNMNCHCARTRFELLGLSAGGLVMDIPACCRNGSFQRWQCLRGNCFCVDLHGNQVGLEQRDPSMLACFDAQGPCVGLQ